MAGYRKLGRTSNQRKAMIRSQVTALLYHGHIKTTETRAKEIRKVAEGLIALAVKEKDNFETVKVTAKVARKDKDGKRVKEVVDGKKVTVYDEVEKKASLGASVTEVLSWVAEGSADAGIAYATDAQTENTNGDDKEVEIVATAENSMMQTPVIYPVGTVSSSAHKDEAKAFEDFLQTDEAKAILEKAGFTINE